MKFGCKAHTLAALQGQLSSAEVLPQVAFTVSDWQQRRDECLSRVISTLGAGSLIVRSSVINEDSREKSLAGYYKSVLNVIGVEKLAQAIDQVIASYGVSESESDTVLIQPMLRGVVRSGVAFNADPNTGALYRVVNYSEGSDTTAVTGGYGGLTYVHAKGAPVVPPPALAKVFVLVDELEAIFPGEALDIEFAICSNDDQMGSERLVLLQVRPLILHDHLCESEAFSQRLTSIERKAAQGFSPHPFLHGRATVYGVMPDWNPAEIIGVRPRPLALSLYRELVTDATWAYQRHNYGYKNLRSFPLLLHFHGLPYIDVRVSFNSFIPYDIDGGLADRLVDYYIDRLVAAPSLHDKVEFEIVFSCYSLDLPDRLKDLGDYGFSEPERQRLADSLRRLTNRIIHPKTGLWRADRDKLAVLTQRREQALDANLDPISRIYWLLEDCKRYGTLPFAGLARAGFIAVQLLKSLMKVGVFSQSDYDAFMGSISTVSGQLTRDKVQLPRATFLGKYGHLRPGTYDILSPRYDEAPDRYFDWSHSSAADPGAVAQFALRLDQMRGIAGLLTEHGLEADVVGLFEFLQAGIELREQAKFIFTRNLSDAMSLMQTVGKALGFTSEDLSFADVRVFYELHVASADVRKSLTQSIEHGKARYSETCQTWLPPLITDPAEVWAFHLSPTEPNFITQKSIVAPVVSHADIDRLSGAIVAITNADPGFDWIFLHPIAGLVTAYGGVNSHMAIRAGELGLPAVIGAGELLFSQWSSANRLAIDCAGKRVEVLS